MDWGTGIWVDWDWITKLADVIQAIIDFLGGGG